MQSSRVCPMQTLEQDQQQALAIEAHDLVALGWAAPCEALSRALLDPPKLVTQEQLNQWAASCGNGSGA